MKINNKKGDKEFDIKKKMKKTAALYLTVFLGIILLISLYININSFKNQFIANELSFYSISAGRLVDKIENGLLYGKSLDNFYGVDQLFRDWTEKNEYAVNVKLISQDKKETYFQMTEEDSYKGLEVNDKILLEVADSDGNLCGYLNVAVNLEERLKLLDENIISFLTGTTILLLLGILIIFIFCWKGHFITNDNKIEKKKILIFMLLLILILQAVFASYSYIALRGFYIEIFNNTGKEIQTLVQDDLDKVIKKGITYDQIYDFEDYTNDVIKKAPVIESITLNGDLLSVTVSQNYIEKMTRKMLIDMLTVLVTSMFIAAEIVNYMMISINRKIEKISGFTSYDKLLSIRVTSFLIHVACYLPVSFIPIMMYRITGGIASDFILGLPIMMLFATGFIFTLLAGNWSIRFGWRKLLFVGVVLIVVSSLLAGLIPNAVVLVFARGIYGAAYALVYVSIREFAAGSSDRQEKSKGLSQVTAGLYAGINIGAVVGSMIFESIGFLGVFIISAIIGLISIYVVKNYCFIESKSSELPQNQAITEYIEVTSEQSSIGMIEIIKNWNMIRLAIFIIAPLAISALYFEYFLPIYAVKEGVTSADIGRAFLVNGIAIAYVAPFIVRNFSCKINEKVSLFLFTMLMAVGFFIFGIWGNVLAILAASAIMGIAEGTALVSQNMIMFDLDVTKKAGTSKMLSIYATIRKLSQTIGPQIFAALMIIGYQFGMVLFGAVIAACSMIYIWSGWIERGEKRE